jgi:4-amino-4-deoxy-L-arabinose transferase-like glycosyltransferase
VISSRDPPDLSPSAPFRRWKEAGLVLLLASWVLLGLVGHDPWKTEDATAFGVARGMMNGGSVLAPSLAGEPYVGRPPLVHALAALAGTALAPPLAPHDAARLATGVLLALTLLFASLATTELGGRTLRWLPMLMLAGSIGMWDRAHHLAPEIGLLAAIAAGMYGFALALRRPVAGGITLGLAAGLGFLACGIAGPLWLVVTAVALPAFCAAWRTRGHAITAAVALAIAVPLVAAWPLALAARSPAHLAAWWADQDAGDWLAPLLRPASSNVFWHLRNLAWFAFPALPLALWTLWIRGRGFNGGLRDPAVQLPATMAAVIFVSVSVMAEPRAIIALPLLVPLAMLASIEFDTLKRGFSGALDWFGILTLGLVAALVWLLWFDTWSNGMTLRIARLFRDTEVGFKPPFQPLAMGISVFLTALWLALVRPARRSNRRALLNWTAGVVLVWGLYAALWLPYLDSRRSYRSVAVDAALHVPARGCIASRNLGEPQRALFEYFGGIVTVREESMPAQGCTALLVQYGRDGEVNPPAGWDVAWQGRRRGDDSELFVLYRKAGT